MSTATVRQVSLLDVLVYELTGKRLSPDYRLKLMSRSQQDLADLIVEARNRLEPPPEPELDTTMPAPSPDEVHAGRTAAGGFAKKTLASWGVPWPPPRGWRNALEKRWRREREMTLEEMR